MSYKKIHNPIDKELSLQFQGEQYFIGAKTTKEFPNDLANHWIEIYGFMSVDNTKAEVKEVKSEVKEVTKEEVKPKKK